MDKTQTIVSSSVPVPELDQSQSSRGTFVVEKDIVSSAVSDDLENVVRNIHQIIHRIKHLESVERERDNLLKRCRKLEICLEKKNNSFRQFMAHLTTTGFDVLDDQSIQLQATFTVDNDHLEMGEGGIDDQSEIPGSSADYLFEVSSAFLDKEKEGADVKGESLILPTYGLFSQDVRLSSTAVTTTDMSATSSISHSFRTDGRDSLEGTTVRVHDDTPFPTEQEDTNSRTLSTTLVASEEEKEDTMVEESVTLNDDKSMSISPPSHRTVDMIEKESSMREVHGEAVEEEKLESDRHDGNVTSGNSMVDEPIPLLMANKRGEEESILWNSTAEERKFVCTRVEEYPDIYECAHQDHMDGECRKAVSSLAREMVAAGLGDQLSGEDVQRIWFDVVKNRALLQPGHEEYDILKRFYITREEREWLCETIREFPNIWQETKTNEDAVLDRTTVSIMMNTRELRSLENRNGAVVDILWKRTLKCAVSHKGAWIRPLVKFYRETDDKKRRVRKNSTI